MRSIFFAILALLNFNLLIGQDYIEYYNFCNEGDKQIYLKNYEEALKNFNKAFSLIDYVHANQYKSASLCAAHIGNIEKTYLYAKNAILNGLDPVFLKTKDFKKFRKTEKYKILCDSISIFQKQHLLSINLNYKKEIDSLYYIDQNIIRNNKSCKGNYNIDKSKLPSNLFELDSVIFEHLLTLIEKYGFPSEKKIGYEGYSNVWVLFHHNVRLPKNSKYLPILKEALVKGEYLPRNYAWMYDQSLMFKQEEPYFYFGIALVDHLSDDKKMEIDKRRKEHGIKPLESTIVKKRGNGIMQKFLW